MSRYLKLADSQRAHITSLRMAIVLLALLALGLGIGWYRAPQNMTIHVPPDLRSGSTRLWWDIPPQSVYAFGLYIFQQMNRWPVDGEQDYQTNITRLGAWRLDDFWVTAVKLQNQTAQRITLDPRELMGEFVTAAFQHPYLGSRGDASDTTTLYLVTRGHGLTQAAVFSATQADPRAAQGAKHER